MNRQTSIQLTAATEHQVDALKEAGFGSFTDIVRLAVDRMYNREVRMEKVFTVTNDRYSKEAMSGTLYELQGCFDDMGWDVQLVIRNGKLIDEITEEIVGE